MIVETEVQQKWQKQNDSNSQVLCGCGAWIERICKRKNDDRGDRGPAKVAKTE